MGSNSLKEMRLLHKFYDKDNKRTVLYREYSQWDCCVSGIDDDDDREYFLGYTSKSTLQTILISNNQKMVEKAENDS